VNWDSLYVEITAVLGLVLTGVTVPVVLLTKKETTSALAWCLLVFFLPIFGSIFFLLFGYQQVHLPLMRKRRHKKRFRLSAASAPAEGDAAGPPDEGWGGMARLARRFGGPPVAQGNHVTFYYEGTPAFDAMLDAVRSAKHHVHLEYFIFKNDGIGRTFLDLLAEKARQGVEVRLLYDAMGSRKLHRADLEALRAAGGRTNLFLPVNPFRRHIQVNLRDHRKILVVDGRVAFTGGLNVGDEYLGLVKRFGFWRDTHLRLEGPAVAALQRVFIEGWDFAAGERLEGQAYFPPPDESAGRQGIGPVPVQVIQSGPDQERKAIREVYFAAVLRAKQRLWIASPYFVPDAGLLDALCLAGYLGVDVRLLCQYHPDKWIPYFTGRYYWSEVLAAGVKVYQYTRGMMHSKMVLVDGEWATVGTANLDNRSLHLNFEVNCLFYSPAVTAELEEAYRRDLSYSIRLEREVFARRPVAGRLVENASRLLSPVL
jgi:cardiolipin synthase